MDAAERAQITAMHCGEQGHWPPRLTGHDGYVKLVRAIVRGVVAAKRRSSR